MAWDIVYDKVPKPVVNKGPAGSKDNVKTEPKDFHHIYVLKKKEVIPEEPNPPEKTEEKHEPS